ncbi:MAG: D-alanyl-D-alanine carboxypeptidase [Pseudonocardiaceae bacterium]|nr:D-alanyl-D-alanine carboxypeptidase [Pseudonocardiaceae bacterium]
MVVVTGVVLALGASGLHGPVAAQPTPPPPVEAGVAPGAPVPDPRPGAAFADPKVAELQNSASRVQRELRELADKIGTARSDVARAAAAATKARAARERADAVVAARQDEVDRYTNAVFNALGKPDELRLFLLATNQRDWLRGARLVAELRADQNARLSGARDRQRAAIKAERAAVRAERSAAARHAELESRTNHAVNRADAVSSELRDEISDADKAVTDRQRAQVKRNRETAANWRDYLRRLRAAGVTPPAAAALRDPAALPAGLEPLRGAGGRAQAGVARWTSPSGERLLVLPEETIAAVSSAVRVLGRPYVPAGGGAGPAAYSCDGLTRSAYTGAGLPLPSSATGQLAVSRPVRRADVQPGDLVFLGPKRYGVQSVGIVLDNRTMLAADARMAGVVVAGLPGGDSVLGFARPALGPRPAAPVPERAEGELRWRCGSVILPARRGDQAAGAWGGYPNGLIPPAALCRIGVGEHALRCDAAAAYRAMSEAFASRFGRPLCITDSYRTFGQQTRLYAQKPGLAAVPGTSNHGWALAVDLCGGLESFGTEEYAWMLANAGAFGWSNPGWARRGAAREEPWHWEFVGRTFR